MQIEIDDDLKKQVMERAREKLVAMILAQFDVKQLAAEIKNAAIKEAAREVAAIIIDRHRSNDVIASALQSVEQRINNSIHAKLNKGITVKFSD